MVSMNIRTIYGIDLGGTAIKFGLFTTSGKLLDEFEIPTDRRDNGINILNDIADVINKDIVERGMEKANIMGLGIGVPGPVNDQGRVQKCVNLGWGLVPVKEELEKLIQLPVYVGNDANVAALGELWQGGGKGFKNAVMITLGTGVGGGILLDGKIIPGSNGAGGEIGHIHVKDGEEASCGCGKKGCLEQYASATGILRSANKKLISDQRPSILKGRDSLTAKEIFDAAKLHDSVALELVHELGDYLGRAMAHISCVVDPEVFIIGGGLSKAGNILIEAIEKYYKVYAFHASRETKITLATLENQAGIFGAADMVLV